MPQLKKYSSAAEKQRAYRDRQLRTAHQKALPAPKKTPRQKAKSRASRLASIEDELRALAEEYQSWRDNMPEGLRASRLAEDLAQVAAKLEELANEVSDLDPPRGFGR